MRERDPFSMVAIPRGRVLRLEVTVDQSRGLILPHRVTGYYDPMGVWLRDRIYLKFLELDIGRREKVEEFIRKYGLPGIETPQLSRGEPPPTDIHWEDLDPYPLERLATYRERLLKAVMLWHLITKRDEESLLKTIQSGGYNPGAFPVDSYEEFARMWLSAVVTRHLRGISMVVDLSGSEHHPLASAQGWEPESRFPVWDLNDAMWVIFAQDILAREPVRRCPLCGAFFTYERATKTYCGERCVRIAAQRRYRARKRLGKAGRDSPRRGGRRRGRI